MVEDTGRLDECRAKPARLDRLEERIDGELVDSPVEGRVVVGPGRLERVTVRGPRSSAPARG